LSEICNDLILARSMPSGAVHTNSTAVPVTVVGENTTPVPTKSGLLRGQRAVDRQISEFGSGSSKAEHDPLIVPGKRQT
jgi:hypothetical protein